MFGRVGSVSFYDENGALRATTAPSGGGGLALDFKVSVNVLSPEEAPRATIEVCGLSSDTMQWLSTSDDAGTEVARRRAVEVRAGYLDEGGARPVFHGVVEKASPTSLPPDVWMRIDAVRYGEQSLHSVSISTLGPTTLGESLKAVVESLGGDVGLCFSPGAQKARSRSKPCWSFSGPVLGPGGLLETMAREWGVCMNFDPSTRTIVVFLRGETAPAPQWPAAKVNVGTGLLGAPTYTGALIEFDSFFRPDLHVNQRIDFKSLLYPKLDNQYTVLNFSHSIHYRGGAWTTHVKAIRSDAGTGK